eukprot:1837898-Pleurochrysis_carterae.AAC.1
MRANARRVKPSARVGRQLAGAAPPPAVHTTLAACACSGAHAEVRCPNMCESRPPRVIARARKQTREG